MAVVSVTELAAPASTYDIRGHRYTKRFHVQTSVTTDREATVLAASGIPAFGTTWTGGTDTDTAAVLSSKSAELIDEADRKNWIVICEFGTQVDVAGWPSSGDQPTYVAPLSRPVRRVHSIIKTQEPMWVDAANKQVVNSAKQSFDPPPMVERTINVVTFYKNYSTFSESLIVEYQDTCNEDDFFGVSQGKAKINSVIPEEVWEGNVGYVRVAWEVHFNYKRWDLLQIRDEGLLVKTTTDAAPVLAKDPSAYPYTQPVLLDGAGHVLDPREGIPQYIDFQPFRRVLFAPLALWSA